MAVDIGQLVGGALGGAVASSVLTPLIAQRGERRALRADVLHRIGDVERLRWFDVGREHDEFRKALDALRAAGLIAGANRELIDYYCHLAWAARMTSEQEFKETDGEGGIPVTLGILVRDAAQALTDDIWHPATKRWGRQGRIEALRSREQSLRDGPERRDIQWPSIDL